MSECRIFLLSPAFAGGERARMIMREAAQFDLAQRLRRAGAPLGEVFTFLSGLYFRGKFAYAKRFARPVDGSSGILVITPNRGLMPADTLIGLDDLKRFAQVNIDEGDPRYRRPLVRDVRQLGQRLPVGSEIILLGSIATGKYIDVLLTAFGERLKFPGEFVGRGDMSRGGLLLRCAVDGTELKYISVAGAVRKGNVQRNSFREDI